MQEISCNPITYSEYSSIRHVIQLYNHTILHNASDVTNEYKRINEQEIKKLTVKY